VSASTGEVARGGGTIEPADWLPLGAPPPVDPNIAYALAYLLQSVATQKHEIEYAPVVQARAPIEPDAPQPKRRRKRHLPKALHRDEIQALLDQPSLRASSGLRDRCVLELMYRAGLRVAEVCDLAPRSINTKEGIVDVLASKSGDRTARFNAATLAPLIDRWKDKRRDLGLASAPTLFCTTRSTRTKLGGVQPAGRRLTPRQVQQMIKRRATKAGIVDPARVTPHKLRHSFATHWLEDGGNIRELQDMLGHSNLGTTEVYLSIVDVDLQAKMQKWDPLAES
jgi:integrase/recombinase XerD